MHITAEGSFSWALIMLKSGYRMRRDGWNGRGMWVELQVPDKGSKMSLPYLYMSTVAGDLVPWLASQIDLMSDDWEAV